MKLPRQSRKNWTRKLVLEWQDPSFDPGVSEWEQVFSEEERKAKWFFNMLTQCFSKCDFFPPQLSISQNTNFPNFKSLRDSWLILTMKGPRRSSKGNHLTSPTSECISLTWHCIALQEHLLLSQKTEGSGNLRNYYWIPLMVTKCFKKCI